MVLLVDVDLEGGPNIFKPGELDPEGNRLNLKNEEKKLPFALVEVAVWAVVVPRVDAVSAF